MGETATELLAGWNENEKAVFWGEKAASEGCFPKAGKVCLFVETECGVDDARCFVGDVFVNSDGNFYLRSGDHSDVDVGFSECFKHLGSDTRVGPHSDPDAGELGNSSLGFDVRISA